MVSLLGIPICNNQYLISLIFTVGPLCEVYDIYFFTIGPVFKVSNIYFFSEGPLCTVFNIRLFFSVGPLCKRFDERKVLIFVGILFMFLGRIIVFPIPGFDHPPLANSTAPESKTSVYFLHSSSNIIVVYIFTFKYACLCWPIFSPFGYGT